MPRYEARHNMYPALLLIESLYDPIVDLVESGSLRNGSPYPRCPLRLLVYTLGPAQRFGLAW